MAITRRVAMRALLAGGGLIGLGLVGGYLLRDTMRLSGQGGGMMSGGMMGSATSADMSLYMDLFNRHTEIRRAVEEVPGADGGRLEPGQARRRPPHRRRFRPRPQAAGLA